MATIEKTYEARGWYKYAARDNWENGEEYPGHDGYTSAEGADVFSAPTVTELLDNLRAFFGIPDAESMTLDDEMDEPGRVDFQRMENDDADDPTPRELEEWKAGRIDLWAATYTVRIERRITWPVHVAEKLARERNAC